MKRLNIAVVLCLFCVLAVAVSCSRKAPKRHSKYVVELIGDNLDLIKIRAIAKANGVADVTLYQWHNHVVLYSEIDQIDDLSAHFANELNSAQVKIYAKPFYNFSKSEHCQNASIASQWKHILLTANLVEDEQMQQAYLDYHSTQFSDWPEIAQGFCNADFQQLLLYRNGRQLMLIISIPAGKTLDELNPKTTENNPRMDEWNQIMGKYQEGIEGTAPDEKWVFLKMVP